MFHDNSCFHVWKPTHAALWMPQETARVLGLWIEGGHSRNQSLTLLTKTTISKFSCSQTETYGIFPHSNFTLRISSCKSHGKVFLRIYPHFLPWFAQVRSRKPSRHPKPLTFLWFSHKHMQTAIQQFKNFFSLHSDSMALYYPYIWSTFPTHYKIWIELGIPWEKDLVGSEMSEAHYHIYLSCFPEWSSKATLTDFLRMLPADKWINQLLPFTRSQLMPSLWQYQDIHLTTGPAN